MSAKIDLVLIINASGIISVIPAGCFLSVVVFPYKNFTKFLLLAGILSFQVECQMAETVSTPFLCILALISGIC